MDKHIEFGKIPEHWKLYTSLNLNYSFFFKKYEFLKWIFQTVIYDLNKSDEIASNIKLKIFNAIWGKWFMRGKK